MTELPSLPGKVYLVGAGPGDPGLMTIKGKTLLEHADCIVHDALISPAILAMMNPKAEQIHAGKRRGQHSLTQPDIIALLMEKAREYPVVVRLKGGDPFVFGRGGEEMVALIQAGIPVEVVPGITAGVAAPAYAGIPITHRQYGSSVTFVTGHEQAGQYQPRVDWSAIAHSSDTIVIYMGMHNLSTILTELQRGGRSETTPIALIRWGTWPQQAELVGTFATILGQIAETGFDAPAIVVIGEVVRVKEQLAEGLFGARSI